MKLNEAFLKSTYHRFLLPAMLSILAGTVNVVIEGVMVGRALGEQGLLVLNLSFPIFLAQSALGVLVASGAAVLSAKAIGRNDLKASRETFGLGFIIAGALAGLLTLAGVLLLGPLTAFLSGGTLPDGFRDYALIILLGGLPRVLIYFPIFFMRLDGRNTVMLGVMVFFLVLNTALVYLFQFILPLGVAGAALANVIATLAASGYALLRLLGKGSSFALPLAFAPKSQAVSLLKTGTPAALNTLSTAARIIILNLLLLSLTGDSRYLVVFTVLTALTELTVCIAIGIPQTAMPILNVYAEEKSGDAIRLLMRRQLLTGLAAITAVSLLLALGHKVVAGLYGLNYHLLLPLAMFGLSLIIGQVNNIFSYYYNATDRIWLANVITVLRIAVLPVLLVLLLGKGSGDWIWLFMPLSELITLLVWLLLAQLIARKEQVSAILLMDKSMEKSAQALDFSVASDNDAICEASRLITDFCRDNDMTPKQTMAISLAIEEILTVMAQQSYGGKGGTFDLRAFLSDGRIGLRIRSGGKRFNPVSLYQEAPEDEQYLGVRMIAGMVRKLEYLPTFGLNNFFIQIQ